MTSYTNSKCSSDFSIIGGYLNMFLFLFQFKKKSFFGEGENTTPNTTDLLVGQIMFMLN